ncbi:MAG: hypothetical protein J0L60_05830 [Ignavibacteria bacterium]|nr:hypothetical protein [Ignavibacteria bacterium]
MKHFKKSFTGITGIIAVLSLLLLSGCEIKEPIAPVWDVELNLPFVNRSYTLKEIVERDTANLKVRSDTAIIIYEQLQDLNSVKIENRMTLDAPVKSIKTTIGAIKVNAVASISEEIKMTQWLNVTPGQNQIVPPITNTLVVQDIKKISSFEVAEFDGGTMSLKLRNENGPIPLSISRIIVRAGKNYTYRGASIAENSRLLTDNTAFTLTQNQERTISFPLTGQKLVDSLRIEVLLSSTGSSGQSVLLPANPVTKITADFANLSVSGVKTVIPQQNPIVKSDVVAIDDSTQYSLMKFDSGKLDISVKNSIDMPLQVTMSVNELKKPDGSAFSQVINVPAKGTGTFSIPSLKDYTVNSGGVLKNTITYSASATNTVQPGVVNTLLSTDSLVSTVSMTNLVISSITGKVKPVQLRIVETDIGINLNDLQGKFRFGKLDLQDSDIKLIVQKATSFEVRFTGKLKGTNGVNTAELDLPVTTLGTGQTTIKLDPVKVEQFILAFQNTLPNRMTVVGVTTLNPNFKEGTAQMIDSVYGIGKLDFPFHVGITNGTISDTVAVDIATGDTAKLNNSNSADVTMVFENGFAAGLRVSGRFVDKDYKTVMNIIPKNTGNDSVLTIKGATVGSDDRVIAAAKDSIKMTLLNADFRNFTKVKHLILEMRINTSRANGLPVKFYALDLFKLRAFGKFSYKVDAGK